MSTLTTPDPAMLRELTQRLQGAMSSNIPERHESTTWILKARESPDFVYYLTALTVIDDDNTSIQTRQYAGLLLKDLVRTSYDRLPDANKSAIRNHIPAGLTSPIKEIQMVSGDVISALAQRATLSAWPGLLPFLIEQAQTRQSDAAIATLFKITEDLAHGPADLDLPSLMALFNSPNGLVRRHAVSTLNNALGKEDVFTLSFPGTYSRACLYECVLDGIVCLQTDKDDEIRKCLCQIYTLAYGLSSAISEKIVAHLQPAIGYIIQVHQESQNSDVLREAAEFWLNTAGSPEFLGGDLAKQPEMASFLESRFDEIVGLLLRTMRYSDEQAAEIETAAAKEAVEDPNKPLFARSRSLHVAEADLSDGEVDDDNEDEEDGTWTVRKCSAAALDVLATAFPLQVAPRVTAFFQQDYDRSSWRDAEVRVLALGAIAEGCRENMFAHVSELTAVLQPFTSHPTAAVRQITAWTMSRYASYFSEYGLDSPAHHNIFGPLFNTMLSLLGDTSSLVQAAATGALVAVEQRIGSDMLPYLAGVIQKLQTCFGRYHGKAMWMLYDCIQALSEHLGPGLSQEHPTKMLMTSLIHRESELGTDSAELLPLVETVSYIASAIAHEFAPYAENQWTYSCNLLSSLLTQIGATNVSPGTGFVSAEELFNVALPADVLADTSDSFYDKIVVSLDLLAAIVEAVPAQVTDRLLPLSPGFFRLLVVCFSVPNKDVRQSAYALLGDCVVHAYKLVQPIVEPLMEKIIVPQLLQNSSQLRVNPWLSSVTSNSCWVVGEIACKQPTGLDRFVPALCESIVPLIHVPSGDSLQENALIAVGRLGFGYAQYIDQILQWHLESFIRGIIQVQWTEEKASAIHGFCTVLIKRQQPIEHFSVWIFFQEILTTPDEFAVLKAPSDGTPMFKTLHDLLYAYKTYPTLAPMFVSFMSETFSKERAELLLNKFSLRL